MQGLPSERASVSPKYLIAAADAIEDPGTESQS
ncbi:MAG: hypothetical protein QOF66_1325 [Mycobacterium sp.]|jgi:hypothetical protein|nr:hypothetical protein [Mycobacterium sp.]